MKSRKLQKATAAAEALMWVSINSIQLSKNDCKRHVVLANISYSYPQMQWLCDVRICIVEIHSSVIILWFFYLYFMKGIKLHWNTWCCKRENVVVIWIRLDTTMQCRGINRKDCSQVTDFGNFGFQSLLRRLGVLEKALRPKFPKSVTCEQSLHYKKSRRGLICLSCVVFQWLPHKLQVAHLTILNCKMGNSSEQFWTTYKLPYIFLHWSSCLVSTGTGNFAPLHVAFGTLPVSLGSSTSVAGILQDFAGVSSNRYNSRTLLLKNSLC